jgi:hypothetical protein
VRLVLLSAFLKAFVDLFSSTEPPLDILYEDLDPSLTFPSSSLCPPCLPSLASAATSPGSSSAALSAPEDSDMDYAGESQESNTSSLFSSTRPSNPPPIDDAAFKARLEAFDGAVLGSCCPACNAPVAVLHDGEGGASCAMWKGGAAAEARGEVDEEMRCLWGITKDVMGPLRRAFAGHGCVFPSRPFHPFLLFSLARLTSSSS